MHENLLKVILPAITLESLHCVFTKPITVFKSISKIKVVLPWLFVEFLPMAAGIYKYVCLKMRLFNIFKTSNATIFTRSILKALTKIYK